MVKNTPLITTISLILLWRQIVMNNVWKKMLAIVLLAGSTFAMVAVSFDAEARRFGGGFSSGRQSTNVMKQNQATMPAAAARAPAAGAAAGATAAGGSRWLGPLTGIAAGLGLAALLSHFGLGGALADLLVIALIAGFAFLSIGFILRALRGGMAPATEPAARGANNSYRRSTSGREPNAGLSGLMGSSTPSFEQQPQVGDWFIPAGFDQQTFLGEAKKQFVAVQKAWDERDFVQLRERLTDEFYAEYAPKLEERTAASKTEIVLLNAEMLGIEKLTNGHLASVRFSGLLREDDAPEAASFEEAWNLFKPNNQGWLLAGIQQLPSDRA
jgi:predicted lipid-binding transport protein (Tim44 family)